MSAFVLKIVASICMLLDHIGETLLPALPILRWVGRIAFPIYAYMIAQGCKHTKNINKYLLRLGIFALISEIPFDMAFQHYTDSENGFTWNINFSGNTNVFYTLFLGVACIAVYEKMKTKKRQWVALLSIPIIPATLLVNFIPAISDYGMLVATITTGLYTAGALCFANLLSKTENANEVPIPFKKKIIPLLVALPLLITAEAFYTDYGIAGVGLIFILYLANPGNRIKRAIILAAGAICLYGNDLITESGDFINEVFVVTGRDLNWHSLLNMLFALMSVVFILFYNGKQGAKIKWAFYAFYPVHITILFFVWYFAIGIIE